jgi:hypothetical protein
MHLGTKNPGLLCCPLNRLITRGWKQYLVAGSANITYQSYWTQKTSGWDQLQKMGEDSCKRTVCSTDLQSCHQGSSYHSQLKSHLRFFPTLAPDNAQLSPDLKIELVHILPKSGIWLQKWLLPLNPSLEPCATLMLPFLCESSASPIVALTHLHL